MIRCVRLSPSLIATMCGGLCNSNSMEEVVVTSSFIEVSVLSVCLTPPYKLLSSVKAHSHWAFKPVSILIESRLGRSHECTLATIRIGCALSQTTSRGSFNPDRSGFASRKHVTHQPVKAMSTKSVTGPHCFMALRRTVLCCSVLHTKAGAGWTMEETRILISDSRRPQNHQHLFR